MGRNVDKTSIINSLPMNKLYYSQQTHFEQCQKSPEVLIQEETEHNA